MRIISIVSILSVSLLVVFCDQRSPDRVSFINYNSELDSITNLYSRFEVSYFAVDLCELFDKTPWDSMAIVLPYLSNECLNRVDFRGNKSAKDTMEHVISVDWRQGLLFFKNGHLTYYSVISASPRFDKTLGDSTSSIPVVKRSECQVLLTNVPGPNGEHSFFFFPIDFVKRYKIGDLKRLDAH